MFGFRAMWDGLRMGMGLGEARSPHSTDVVGAAGNSRDVARVCVDLTDVLPPEVEWDAVVWPAEWHRRGELLEVVCAAAVRDRSLSIEIFGDRADARVEQWWIRRGAALSAAVGGRIRLRLC